MYRTSYYVPPYNRTPVRDKTVDTLIQSFFHIFSILYQIIPVLIILNIAGVTHISWWLLLCSYLGWHVIDCLSDILQIRVEVLRNKRDQKAYEERMKQHQAHMGVSADRYEIDELQDPVSD